jgi:hypothetical protein
VSVLFVVTWTVVPAMICTEADGLKVGAPNEYPVTIGSVGSLIVQEVPAGMSVMVIELPALTLWLLIKPIPQSKWIVKGPV